MLVWVSEAKRKSCFGLKTLAERFALAKVPTAADIWHNWFLPPIESRWLP
jgi:hypothetical protein